MIFKVWYFAASTSINEFVYMAELVRMRRVYDRRNNWDTATDSSPPERKKILPSVAMNGPPILILIALMRKI